MLPIFDKFLFDSKEKNYKAAYINNVLPVYFGLFYNLEHVFQVLFEFKFATKNSCSNIALTFSSSYASQIVMK